MDPHVGNHQLVNDALAELADRLQIPCDIIAVHRADTSRGGRERKYTSLRYGAFLLAYAPFEAFLDQLTGYRATKGRVLGTSPDRVREAFRSSHGVANVTQGWKARTRVAPKPGTGGRSPWEQLEGDRLRDYLGDMKHLRDLLGHGKDPRLVANTAGTLWQLRDGRSSMRLMGVEGWIQAVQDLAVETAIAVAGSAVVVPAWPTHPSTGASDYSRLPAPYTVPSPRAR